MSGYSDGRRVAFFWSHVQITPGCWLWTASTNAKGYGQFGVANGRCVLTHRFSFELHHGPLDGRWALHRCDNPPCVNPDHLYAGTVTENVRDMLARGRHVTPRGEASPNAVLTDEQVREIRQRHIRGLNRWRRGNTVALAEEFGISPRHVQNIAAGVWRRSA